MVHMVLSSTLILRSFFFFFPLSRLLSSSLNIQYLSWSYGLSSCSCCLTHLLFLILNVYIHKVALLALVSLFCKFILLAGDILNLDSVIFTSCKGLGSQSQFACYLVLSTSYHRHLPSIPHILY